VTSKPDGKASLTGASARVQGGFLVFTASWVTLFFGKMREMEWKCEHRAMHGDSRRLSRGDVVLYPSQDILAIWKRFDGFPMETLTKAWMSTQTDGPRQRSVPLMKEHFEQYGNTGNCFDLALWLFSPAFFLRQRYK
jgi:hypothetical protein